MSRGSIKAIDRRRTADENVLIDQVSTGATYQTVSVTDIISEGEIEGLVDGGNSIYVNGDPLFAEEEVGTVPPSTATASSTTTSGSLTTAVSLSESITSQQPLDVDGGKRFLIIKKAVETTVTLSNAEEISINNATAKQGFQVDMTAPSALFKPAYKHEPYYESSLIKLKVFNRESVADHDVEAVLETAEGDLRSYIEVTGSSDTATAKFISGIAPTNMDYSAETATGNTHTLTLDLWLEIHAVSGSTITLKQAPPIAFTTKKFEITEILQRTDEYTKKNDQASYQFRTGTLNQAPMTYLNGIGSSSVPLTVPSGALERGTYTSATAGSVTSKTITTANLTGAQASEIDQVRFLIQYGNGLYQYHKDRGGDRHTGVGYRVEVGIKRGASEAMPWTVLGGNLKAGTFKQSDTAAFVGEDIVAHGALFKGALSYEYTIDLRPFQPFSDFSVRITRLTNHCAADAFTDPHWWNDSTEEKLEIAASHWDGVVASQITSATGVMLENLNFPYTAMSTTRFSSKQFQSVPKRTYDVRGIRVLVPSNYVTREENTAETTNPGQVALYTRNTSTKAIETTLQPWDGEFRKNLSGEKYEKVYTNNPAWVFYDILVNDRYGLGEWLKSTDIDKYSLYKIGRYCDELVNDGKGGKEPRFTANLYLQKATDAYKVLKDMATIFRGMIYWLGGEVVPVIDEKKYPVYNFSKANVINGEFSYESSGSKTRANQYIVSWNNPDANYKLEPIIVEDRANIITSGKVVSEKAVAFGCTSEGQAIRYGRWKLWTAVNQTEVIGFKTAINAGFLQPGDIINVQDADEFDIPFSGRVSSYSETGSYTVTLDRDIDANLISSGYTYTIAIVIPKKAAILNQDSATIGTVAYTRGDIVTQARLTHGGSQATIVVTSDATTNLNVNNALDDSNEVLSLVLQESTIVQERSLTGSTTINSVDYTFPASAVDGKTTVQITEALEEDAMAHLPDAIWVIKQTDTAAQRLTMTSPKEYKILGIRENEGGEFEINGVEHYNEKFDDIEGDFNTAVDDPVYPPEPDASPPAPNNVIIMRTPWFWRNKEEVQVRWEPPTAYEYLKGYEVTHNFNADREIETFFASPSQIKKRFLDLPDAEYEVAVRTISTFNKRSKPAIAKVSLKDVFSGERVHGGIRKGGLCTTTIEQESDGSGKVFFAKPSYQIGPHKDDVTDENLLLFQENNSSNAKSLSIDCSALSGANSTAWAGNKVAAGTYAGTPFAYIFYDFSETSHASNDPIKLISWKNETGATRNGNLFYWYDADAYRTSASSIWSQISGTVEIANGSNKVIGTNTTFTQLDFQNIFYLSSTQAGRISYIESDTVLYLDRNVSTAISAGSSAYVDALGIDYENDFIIGTIHYTAGSPGVYTLKSFLQTMQPVQTRGLIVNSNAPTLNYNSSEVLTTAWGSEGLNLTIQALNFSNPEIQITGSGFTQTNQNAETAWTAADYRANVKVHSVSSTTSPLVTFAGGALDFVITAREKEDHGINRQITHTISKSKDSAAEDSAGIVSQATNLSHTFFIDSSGNVTNNFESFFDTYRDGVKLIYASSGTTANTYNLTAVAGGGAAHANGSNTAQVSSEDRDPSGAVDTQAKVTLDTATSEIIQTDSVLTGSITVTITDNADSDAILAVHTIRLYKVSMPTRVGSTLTITSSTYAENWASGNFNTTTARAIADLVIAHPDTVPDGTSNVKRIVPNDRITVTDGAATPIVATRIYNGPATNVSTNITHSTTYWSSVVVNEIDGSMIVAGTLSADKLKADSATTGALIVGNNLQIGESGNTVGAKLFSYQKTSFTDTDAGFYMDGSGDFTIGSASAGSLSFDASAGTLVFNGTFQIGGNTVNDSYIAGKAPVQSVQGGTLNNGVLTITAGGLSISHTDVSGLGSLATANSVAAGNVTGLGALATLNTVTAANHVTGLLNSATNATAFSSAVSAENVIKTITTEGGSAKTVTNNSVDLTASDFTITSSHLPNDVVYDADIAGTITMDTSVTNISAGKIILTSGVIKFTTSTNESTYIPDDSIVLDTTTGKNRILIKSGSTTRVILGKLVD